MQRKLQQMRCNLLYQKTPQWKPKSSIKTKITIHSNERTTRSKLIASHGVENCSACCKHYSACSQTVLNAQKGFQSSCLDLFVQRLRISTFRLSKRWPLIYFDDESRFHRQLSILAACERRFFFSSILPIRCSLFIAHHFNTTSFHL